MFSIGDRVKLKVSGREGIIIAKEEPSFAPGSKDLINFTVELDGGVGTTTVWETGLEVSDTKFWKAACECGLKFARSGGKHSSYCPAGTSE